MIEQIITESHSTPKVPTIVPPQSAVIVTAPTQLEAALLPFTSSRVLAIDTETTGLDPLKDEIRLIQIAAPKRPTLIIDCSQINRQALAPVWSLLSGPAVKLFHNAKFDIKFLVRAGLPFIPNVFDTMLAAQLLKAGLAYNGFGLADLVKEYLGEDLPKEQQKSDWSLTLTPAQLQYAAKDAETLLRLFPPLHQALNAAGLLEAAQIECDCVFAVAQMELTGITLDIKAILGLGRELETERKRLRAKLREYFFDVHPDLNPNSTDQLKKALCGSGIKVPNTSKETLNLLKDKYPIVQDILEYKSVAKAVQGFSEKLPGHIHEATGRIHPEFRQLGPATGRFSCSNPNLQQIPRKKEFRSCFIPARGCKFVIADYSQIELRIAAEISKDSKMIGAYSQGLDLHQLTASLLTGKKIEQITKEERQAAKAVNFGLIYAMGAEGLRAYAKSTYGVDLTKDQALVFRQRFFAGYQGLARWHWQTNSKPASEARTLSGRRRRWQSAAKITEMLNTPVQGTSADILKVSLGELPKALASTGAKIVGSVHDEIILEVPEEKTEEAAVILKDVMEAAGKRFLKQVPVLAEPIVADSWADK
jgi:DNA polymerase I-like protein with 3'-5' exonuclease and polymerase domains